MSVPPSLWQVEEPWEGFPRLEGAAAADVVIVGAGVTGCACALRLAQGGASVLVLEADRVASGASGRNGGPGRDGPRGARRRGADPDGGPARAEAAAVRRTASLWLATTTEAEPMSRAVTALAAAGVDCRAAPELIPPP